MTANTSLRGPLSKALIQFFFLVLVGNTICSPTDLSEFKPFPLIKCPSPATTISQRDLAIAEFEKSRRLSMVEIGQAITVKPRPSQNSGQTKRKSSIRVFLAGLDDKRRRTSSSATPSNQGTSAGRGQAWKAWAEGLFTRDSLPENPLHTSSKLITPEVREDFLDRVMRPLAQCHSDSRRIGLAESALEEFLNLTYEMMHFGFAPIIDGPKDLHLKHNRKGIDLDISLLTLAADKPLPSNFDRHARYAFAKMTRIWDLLQNPKSLDASKGGPLHYSIMFRLNDVWVEFLAVSAKHNLLSKECLGGYLNSKNAARGMFNYINARFVTSYELTPLHLPLDLRLGLEESRFAEDIQSLIPHITPETWQTITRLYLLAQLKSISSYDKAPAPGEILKLRKEFLDATSQNIIDSSASLRQSSVTVFFDSLIDAIFESATAARQRQGYYAAPRWSEMIRHEYLISMLRYMVQYHGQDILRKSIARLHDEGLYPHLQAYDEAALLYSDALDSVYAKFGEVLQKLPIPELADKRSEWRRWQLIYLTNRGQRNQPSILSLGADHELPIKYDEEVPLDQSIGIEKPNYRFRHLLLQEVASYPVWRRNMEQNLRESRVTHPTPPTIAMLEEESRHILYMLQNKIPTLSPSEQASKLVQILDGPLRDTYDA
ncbi:hypothetical protein MJO28_012176 [Puccinia striiformis f. sp. tritici]|uniref:Uncharacterized protein n=1 Tax=Puccinia striiformis f. sp. tritici TaxID=168172 RepID=A0ACC0E142_9BASI|nr:hypothetical protein MJO28_012176 [Puccinia striiformis f. sp. tritici]